MSKRATPVKATGTVVRRPQDDGDQDVTGPEVEAADSTSDHAPSEPASAQSDRTGHAIDALCDVLDRLIDRVTWDGDDGSRVTAHQLVDDARRSVGR